MSQAYLLCMYNICGRVGGVFVCVCTCLSVVFMNECISACVYVKRYDEIKLVIFLVIRLAVVKSIVSQISNFELHIN